MHAILITLQILAEELIARPLMYGIDVWGACLEDWPWQTNWVMGAALIALIAHQIGPLF